MREIKLPICSETLPTECSLKVNGGRNVYHVYKAPNVICFQFASTKVQILTSWDQTKIFERQRIH
jgi:hypothetical protein